MDDGNNQYPYENRGKDSSGKSSGAGYEQLDSQTLENIANAFMQRSMGLINGNAANFECNS